MPFLGDVELNSGAQTVWDSPTCAHSVSVICGRQDIDRVAGVRKIQAMRKVCVGAAWHLLAGDSHSATQR